MKNLRSKILALFFAVSSGTAFAAQSDITGLVSADLGGVGIQGGACVATDSSLYLTTAQSMSPVSGSFSGVTHWADGGYFSVGPNVYSTFQPGLGKVEATLLFTADGNIDHLATTDLGPWSIAYSVGSNIYIAKDFAPAMPTLLATTAGAIDGLMLTGSGEKVAVYFSQGNNLYTVSTFDPKPVIQLVATMGGPISNLTGSATPIFSVGPQLYSGGSTLIGTASGTITHIAGGHDTHSTFFSVGNSFYDLEFDQGTWTYLPIKLIATMNAPISLIADGGTGDSPDFLGTSYFSVGPDLYHYDGRTVTPVAVP